MKLRAKPSSFSGEATREGSMQELLQFAAFLLEFVSLRDFDNEETRREELHLDVRELEQFGHLDRYGIVLYIEE